MTAIRSRRIVLGTTYNLRDVGGYPVAGGGSTGWGRLLRSDATAFGPADRAGLAELGLRTVIDLRDEPEFTARPTGLAEFGPEVRHRPLDPRPLLTPRGTPDRLVDLYRSLLRERGDRLAAIVDELAEPGALPALVHCAAGKDRTGIVVALVLSAVGVPDDVVSADYALTGEYLTPAFFAGLGQESGAADPADAELHAAPPAAVATVLAELATAHGSTADYLIDNGLAPARVGLLRAALTT